MRVRDIIVCIRENNCKNCHWTPICSKKIDLDKLVERINWRAVDYKMKINFEDKINKEKINIKNIPIGKATEIINYQTEALKQAFKEVCRDK